MPVSERIGLSALLQVCSEKPKDAPDPIPPELAQALARIADECRQRIMREAYFPALASTYYRADLDAVAAELKSASGKADLESLLAYSHNTAIITQMKQMHDQATRAYRDAMVELDELRAQQVQLSAAERDQEVAVAREQHRRRMLAVAAGLQAMGQAMAQPQRTYAPIAVSTPGSSAACSSDYDCNGGVGYTCVKQNYSATGFCATAVNGYGVQTFNAPQANSVMVKVPVSTDCKFVTDCPAGFSCDASSGACLR